MSRAYLLCTLILWVTIATGCATPANTVEQGEGLVARGDYDGAIAKFDQVATRWSDSPEAERVPLLVGNALLEKARNLRSKGDIAAALRTYLDVPQRAPDSLVAAIASSEFLETPIEFAEKLEAEGDTAGAVDMFVLVRDKFPGTDAAKRAGQAVARLRCEGGQWIAYFANGGGLYDYPRKKTREECESTLRSFAQAVGTLPSGAKCICSGGK